MKIFVGNLLFEAKDIDVAKLFEGFGNVISVKIVMEKNGKKSRGFGFVEMPDDEQAQAAIAALDGTEFMGRTLNVSPARPKPEVEHNKYEEKKMHLENKFVDRPHTSQEERQDAWYNPVFNKKRGRYKTGRRSRSYMKRRAEAGVIEEVMPKREKHDNPMRWRKRSEQPRPWRKKSEGLPKPWKSAPGEPPKPWQKKESGHKPWKKSAGESKPWRKSSGKPKFWNKNKKRPRPHQSRIQSRRKPGGYIRGN